MRDQGTASENVLATDLSSIDENITLSPEDLNRIITTILSPSIEVIDATFATGQNTKIFISLCKKMEFLIDGDLKDATKDQLDASKALGNVNLVTRVMTIDPNKQQDLEYALVLRQNRKAEKLMFGATSAYADAVKDFGAAVRTMIKLGERLLADQEVQGSSIKTGRAGIKYAFTCKAIDGQWKAMKGAFAEMKRLRETVETLAERRKTQDVVFIEGNHLVAGQTVSELSKALGEICEEKE